MLAVHNENVHNMYIKKQFYIFFVVICPILGNQNRNNYKIP